MHWSEEYPHNVYQQVLLANGKMIDYKIGGYKKESWDWTSFKSSVPKGSIITVETNVICVHNNDEHNEAFYNKEWFKQFEYSEFYPEHGLRPF